MENKEKILIHKNRIRFNIVSIVLIIFAILMAISQLDMIKGIYYYEIDVKIVISTIYTFIIALCLLGIGIYLQIKENKKSKNIFDIKENGRIIKGEVISIIRERHIRSENGNGLTTKFVVKFKDKNMEDKYIITQVLPNKFDYIEVVETTNNLEDIITLEFIEHYGNGYITFDENDTVPNIGVKFNNIFINGEKIKFNGKRGRAYKRNVTRNNYKGHIVCNVYEKDGRYVIDDYEGVEFTVEKNNWFDYLMIIVFIVVSIVGLYFSMKK